MPTEPTERSRAIAEAYRMAVPYMRGFEVLWMNDEPHGLMLHCNLCGVHDFRPTEERTMGDLFESALGHRQVCPNE